MGNIFGCFKSSQTASVTLPKSTPKYEPTVRPKAGIRKVLAAAEENDSSKKTANNSYTFIASTLGSIQTEVELDTETTEEPLDGTNQ